MYLKEFHNMSKHLNNRENFLIIFKYTHTYVLSK